MNGANKSVKYKSPGKIKTLADKVFVLIQCKLGKLNLQNQVILQADCTNVTQIAERIVACFVAYYSQEKTEYRSLVCALKL